MPTSPVLTAITSETAILNTLLLHWYNILHFSVTVHHLKLSVFLHFTLSTCIYEIHICNMCHAVLHFNIYFISVILYEHVHSNFETQSGNIWEYVHILLWYYNNIMACNYYIIRCWEILDMAFWIHFDVLSQNYIWLLYPIRTGTNQVLTIT